MDRASKFTSPAVRALTIVLPAAVVAFTTLGLQQSSVFSQLFISAAAACLLLSVFVLGPALLQRYQKMQVIYARRDAIVAIAERAQQRQQYYVLNYSKRYHTQRQRTAVLMAA